MSECDFSIDSAWEHKRIDAMGIADRSFVVVLPVHFWLNWE